LKRLNTRKLFPRTVIVFVLIQGVLIGCAKANQGSIGTRSATTPIQSPSFSGVTRTPTPPSVRTLASVPSDCIEIAVSPDLSWIVTDCSPGHELKVGKIGDSQTVTLFAARSENPTSYVAAFSPDSTNLVVVQEGGPIWLYAVGQWQAPRMLRSRMLRSNWMRLSVPFWAPDGQSLAVTYLSEGQALSVLRLDVTVKNLLAFSEVHKVMGEVANLFGPSWSPDGTRIAYVITTNTLNPEPIQLWTIEVATGKKQLLYAGKPGEFGYRPVWSPDGSKIAVDSLLQESNSLSIFDLRQKTFVTIMEHPPSLQPVWSPDSRHLAVCASPADLYIVSVESGQSELVSRDCGFLMWKDENTVITDENWKLDLISVP